MPTDDAPEPGPQHGDAAGHPPVDPTPPGRADVEAITRLLARVADDPDAPPSRVTADSVLAAARSARPAPGTPARGGLTAVPGEGRPSGSRRRTGRMALLAAASVAAFAAIIVPLTVNGGGATNTASDSAQEVAVDGTGAPADPNTVAQDRSAADAAAAAAAAPEQDSAASAAAGSATAEPPDASAPAAAAQPQPSNGGSDDSDVQSEAGGSAIGQSAAADSAAAAGKSCWPPLRPAAAAALTAALPAGAFAAPAPLEGACANDPVAGAVLAGAVPGTDLLVRAVNAEPGSCARNSGGARCVVSADPSTGEDRYTAADPAGALTVYVYGNGREVAVGSAPSANGIPTVPSGLSADQLDTAARALLAAL